MTAFDIIQIARKETSFTSDIKGGKFYFYIFPRENNKAIRLKIKTDTYELISS
jgi:hypothetical protein